MRGFLVALSTELTKALKSKMLWVTFIFFAFIALMLGFLMLIAKHPEIGENSEVLSMKASLLSRADWPTFLGLLLQMALTVGSMGSAIVAVWVFGREYADRTIKDILVLPVSRLNIVLAKLVIIFFWSLLLLMFLYVFAIFAGFAINLDGWTSELFRKNCIVYCISALLTVLLFPVISLITCISRGYLLSVGIAILLLITTQFLYIGMPGIAPYFPWTIPGLFSGVAGPFSPKPEAVSYIILGMTSLLGSAGTAAWWRYADQH